MIQIVDTSSGAAVRRFPSDHAEYVSALAFSPDGRQLLSGSEDGTLQMWDADTGTAVGPRIDARGRSTMWLFARTVAGSPVAETR